MQTEFQTIKMFHFKQYRLVLLKIGKRQTAIRQGRFEVYIIDIHNIITPKTDPEI